MIIAGMSNKKIAAKLKMTVNTVKTHTNSIYGKLQANRRLRSPEQCHQGAGGGDDLQATQLLG
jgi:DNA-binding NarL/FixJ family response regulator